MLITEYRVFNESVVLCSEITAVDQNTLTATYTITVSVLPVNQPPGFNPTSDTISINERQVSSLC